MGKPLPELAAASGSAKSGRTLLLLGAGGDSAARLSAELKDVAVAVADAAVAPKREAAFKGVSALLVDRGAVRRVFGGNLGVDTIAGEVRLWLDGREWFGAQCARCHGEDGKDEGYPGAKSLGGIGNRHSEAEIIERTERSGFVNLSSMTPRARRALGVFVAGL